MSQRAVQPRVRAGAIVRRGDGVLLVKHVKPGRAYWLLPGGGVEFGESLAEALAREVLEETGLEVAVGPLVLVNDTIAPDGSRHVVNLSFLAEATGGELAVGDDPVIQDAAWMPIERIMDVVLHPDIREPLVEGLRNGFAGPVYVGSLWSEAGTAKG